MSCVVDFVCGRVDFGVEFEFDMVGFFEGVGVIGECEIGGFYV